MYITADIKVSTAPCRGQMLTYITEVLVEDTERVTKDWMSFVDYMKLVYDHGEDFKPLDSTVRAKKDLEKWVASVRERWGIGADNIRMYYAFGQYFINSTAFGRRLAPIPI